VKVSSPLHYQLVDTLKRDIASRDKTGRAGQELAGQSGVCRRCSCDHSHPFQEPQGNALPRFGCRTTIRETCDPHHKSSAIKRGMVAAHVDFRFGDIMTRSFLVAVAVAFAGVASMAVSAPCFAKSHEHVRYAGARPVVEVSPSTAPQFIAIGTNGYWVTTTWSCWVDDGQSRIHDCNSP
jgi:hypothetical protein